MDGIAIEREIPAAPQGAPGRGICHPCTDRYEADAAVQGCMREIVAGERAEGRHKPVDPTAIEKRRIRRGGLDADVPELIADIDAEIGGRVVRGARAGAGEFRK